MDSVERRYVMHNWSRQDEVKILDIAKAEGCHFTDVNGRDYLDFSSQLVCSNLGHSNSRIKESIKEQLEDYAYISPAFGCGARANLARELAAIAPGSFRKTFFSTGGAEAVEAAVKAAKLFRDSIKIISRYRSYHGSLAISSSITGDFRRTLKKGPEFPGVIHTVPPYCYRCPFKLSYPDCGLLCAEAIHEQVLHEGGDSVAAIILEPIIGSNGVIVPPPGYYERVREICDEFGIVWIDDEVMTGFGRTGKMFGIEHWDAKPDIICMAKGLTGGYVPLGATLMNEEISDFFETHRFAQGHTYSGHPLGCAAAIGALEEYKRNGFVERAASLGPVFEKRLRELHEEYSIVGDVRGVGCFWGIELVSEALAERVSEDCLKNGVFILQRNSTLILAPPLIIDEPEIADALDKIGDSIKAAE